MKDLQDILEHREIVEHMLNADPRRKGEGDYWVLIVLIKYI
jgi:hypothetical protein